MNQYEEMSANRGRLMLGLCNRIISAEVSKDYTLPDYHPEIRRVLGVSEHILPPAKYVSGDGVELSGAVDYTLMYVGADGELYSAPLSDEYDINVPLESCSSLDRDQPLSVAVSMTAENISARVTAPRKVSIRCRMNCHARIYGSALLEEEIVGEGSEESIQRLTREGEYASVWSGSSELIEVADELDADGESRVVSADASVTVGDISSESDGVLVRGDVILKLICDSGKDRGYSVMRRRLPFSEKVETGRMGAGGDMRRARGSISSISINQEEGKISSSVGFFLEAEEESDLPFCYTADLYSTERICECHYEDVRVPFAAKNICGSLSQSERIPFEGTNIPEGAEIVDITGRGRVEEIKVAEGRCVITGEARYWLVCRKNGEFSSAEIKLPFRYETDIEGELDPLREDGAIDCSIGDCRVRTEGETLAVDAEISLCGVVFGNRMIRRVKSASMGEVIDRSGSDIVICYPSVGESIWNVAKKYLVAPKDVMGNPECDRYCIIQM